VIQATILVGLIGICWAVACWVPFAIIMEFLKEINEKSVQPQPNEGTVDETSRRRTVSTPRMQTDAANERQPLIRRRSYDEAVLEGCGSVPVAGGTVLGIHNLAIVFPQFITALVSSAIFHIVDADIDKDPTNHNTYLGKNGVAWVLRFGGLCTLFGAIFSRMVPPTKTEKEMRRTLAEMRELREAITP